MAIIRFDYEHAEEELKGPRVDLMATEYFWEEDVRTVKDTWDITREQTDRYIILRPNMPLVCDWLADGYDISLYASIEDMKKESHRCDHVCNPFFIVAENGKTGENIAVGTSVLMTDVEHDYFSSIVNKRWPDIKMPGSTEAIALLIKEHVESITFGNYAELSKNIYDLLGTLLASRADDFKLKGLVEIDAERIDATIVDILEKALKGLQKDPGGAGTRLKALIDEKCVKHKAFAEMTEILPSTLSRFLNNRQKMSDKYIDRAAKQIGSTFEYIKYGTGEPLLGSTQANIEKRLSNIEDMLTKLTKDIT